MKKIMKTSSILRIVAFLTLLATFLTVLTACEVGDYVCKHEWVSDPSVEATCTSEGLTAGQHCALCGLVLTKQETLPKTDHTYDDAYDASCNVCGALRQALCKHGDAEHFAKKEPSCEEDGNIEYWYCAQCRTYFSDRNLTSSVTWAEIVRFAPGHIVVIDEAVAPTINSTGLTEGSHCSTCKKTLAEQTSIPKLEPGTYSITYNSGKPWALPEIDSKYTQYREGQGLTSLPYPEKAGYRFLGWYKADGTAIKEIPQSSKENYNLFAEWELITYSITYNSCDNSEGFKKTYTVEDETFPLPTASFPGLIFEGWTLGNPYEDNASQERPIIDKITKGTTGNIEVTAEYHSMINVLIEPNNGKIIEAFDQEQGQYFFAFHIGTYDNVILRTTEIYTHASSSKYDKTIKWIETTEENTSTSLAHNVSSGVILSESWSNIQKYVSEYNSKKTTSSNVSAEAGVKLNIIGGKINANHGISNERTLMLGYEETNTNEGGYQISSNTSETLSNYISYAKSTVTETEQKFDIPANSPVGKYVWAECADVYVYAIVRYDISTDTYHLSTYSVMNNYGTMQVYARNSSELTPGFEEIEYSIDEEAIENTINGLTFINFNANGGKGTMPKAAAPSNGSYTLPDNKYTNDNRAFLGWSRDPNATTPEFANKAVVNDLKSDAGHSITLYAIWTPAEAFVIFNAANGTRDKYIPIKSSFTERVHTGLSKSALMENGYKNIVITIVFDAQRQSINQTTAAKLEIVTYAGSLQSKTWHTEEFANNKWTNDVKVTFTIAVSQLNDDGSFDLKWSNTRAENDGGSLDGWTVGETSVNIKATK